jgi:hypothetical protein
MFCLNSIKQVTGLLPILITPSNMKEWCKVPLHPAYEYLSFVHRADYLRCYFMHHYGGAYADIKKQSSSWITSLFQLNNSNKIANGYMEVSGGVACVQDQKLYNEMSLNYSKLIGNCAYIFKSNSFFTKEWLDKTHELLDAKLTLLRLNPASHPRDHTGLWLGHKYSTYPLQWSELLGQIFHPLVYKYHNYFLQTVPTPIFSDYL